MDPTIDFRHHDYDKTQDFTLRKTGPQEAGNNDWGSNDCGRVRRPQRQVTSNQRQFLEAQKGKGTTCTAQSRKPKGHLVLPTLLVLVDKPPPETSLHKHERDWNAWSCTPQDTAEDESSSSEHQPAAADVEGEEDEEDGTGEPSPEGKLDDELCWRHFQMELQELADRSYKHVENMQQSTLIMATQRPTKPFRVLKPVQVPAFRDQSSGVFNLRDILQRCAGPLQHQLEALVKQEKPCVVELKWKPGRQVILTDPEGSTVRDSLKDAVLLLRNFIFLYKGGNVSNVFDPSLKEGFVGELKANMKRLEDLGFAKFEPEEEDEIWDLTVKDAGRTDAEYKLTMKRGEAQGFVLVHAARTPVKHYTLDVMHCPGLPYSEELSDDKWELFQKEREEAEAAYARQWEEYQEQVRQWKEAAGEGPAGEAAQPRPKRLLPPRKPPRRAPPGAVYEAPDEPPPGFRLTLTAARLLRPAPAGATVEQVAEGRLYDSLADFVADLVLDKKEVPRGPLVGQFQTRTGGWRQKKCTIWRSADIEVVLESVRQDTVGDINWAKYEVEFRSPAWRAELEKAQAGGSPLFEVAPIMASLTQFARATYLLTTGKDGGVADDELDFAAKQAAEWIFTKFELPKLKEQERKEREAVAERDRQERLQRNGFFLGYQYVDGDDEPAGCDGELGGSAVGNQDAVS